MKNFPGLGSRIHELRKKNNLTADKLADAIGVSAAAIIKYEKEQIRPSWEVLDSLATRLNTSSKYLLFGEDNEIISRQGIDVACEMAKQLLNQRDLNALEKLVTDFVLSRAAK